MKRKLLSLTLLSALIMTPAFAKHDSHNAQDKKDGEILGLLIVLNNNEIASGKEALQKTNNSAVKDYANKMIDQHSQNLDQTYKLGQKIDVQPEMSSKAEHLKKEGEKELHQLSDKEGAKFDKAYISDMVNDHKDALKLLDEKIKKAENPEVKDHLTATRDAVAHHLEQAKEVQSSLKS